MFVLASIPGERIELRLRALCVCHVLTVIACMLNPSPSCLHATKASWWSSPHCIHCPTAAPPAPPLALHTASAHLTDAPAITTYATSNTHISPPAHPVSCHPLLTHIHRQTTLLKRPGASFINTHGDSWNQNSMDFISQDL